MLAFRMPHLQTKLQGEVFHSQPPEAVTRVYKFTNSQKGVTDATEVP
jgi:hypothetical protein